MTGKGGGAVRRRKNGFRVMTKKKNDPPLRTRSPGPPWCGGARLGPASPRSLRGGRGARKEHQKRAHRAGFARALTRHSGKKRAVGRPDPRARVTPAARYPSGLLTSRCWRVRCSLSGLTRSTPPRRQRGGRAPPAPPARARALSRLGIVAVRIATNGPGSRGRPSTAARPRLSYSLGATPAIVNVYLMRVYRSHSESQVSRLGEGSVFFHFFLGQGVRSPPALPRAVWRW